MSNTEIANVKVMMNGEQAAQELRELETLAEKLKKELRQAKVNDDQKGVKKLEKELKGVRSEMKEVKKQAFDVDNVLKNLNGSSFNQLNAASKKLTRELKNMTRGTKEWTAQSKKIKLVKNEMAKVNAEMRANKSWTQKASGAFNNYFGIIAAGMASLTGVILVFRKAISAFEDFEERMANLSALTGLSGNKLKWLGTQAKEMSQSVVEGNIRITKSSDDIVDAYTKVGSQRPELLKNKEALAAVTKDSLILAEASKMELEPATASLTNIMNQFNAEAKDSRRIINAVAAGSKVGAADIPYLSTAVEKAGTTMNLMNIPLEKGLGLIEAVAPKYKRAETAGNSLDKVLLKMKEKQIGYTNGVFDMNDAIDELRVRFNNGETSAQLFGVEHSKMAEILVQSQADFNKYSDAVTDTNVALEQAAKNTNIAKAAKQQHLNEIHNMAIELGEKLNPAMLIGLSIGTKVLRGTIALIDMYKKYKHVIIPLVAGLAAYTAVTKASIVWDKAKFFWNEKLIAGIKKLSKATKTNPWGLLAAAVAIAIVAIKEYIDYQKKAEEFTNKFNKALASESGQMNTLFEELKKTNKGSAERKGLIKEINDKYGEYLPNLLTEKSTLDEIKTAQNQANDALYKNILLKKKREAMDAANTAIIESQLNLTKHTTESGAKELLRITEKLATLNKESEAYKTLFELVRTGVEYDINGNKVTHVLYQQRTQQILKTADALREQKKIIKDIDDAYKNLERATDKSNTDETPTGGNPSGASFNIQDLQVSLAKYYKLEVKYLLNRKSKDQGFLDWYNEYNDSLVKSSRNAMAKEVVDLNRHYDNKLIQLKIAEQKEINAVGDNKKAKEEIHKEYAVREKELQKTHTNELISLLKEQLDESKLNINLLPEDKIEEYKSKIEKLKLELAKLEETTSTTDEEDSLDEEDNGYESRLTEVKAIAQAEMGLIDDLNNYAKQQEENKIRDLQKATNDKLKIINDAKEKELKALEDKHKKGLISDEDYEQAKSNINSKYNKQREAAEESFRRKEEEIKKTQFERDKSLNIVKAIMNTALGITSALSSSPPPVNAILAGITAASGAVQIATISAQQYALGKYDVLGDDDGKLYSANYSGNVKTGLYTEPTLGLFAEQGNEIVIDGPTTSNIMMNAPEILDAINYMRVPRYADGKDMDVVQNTETDEKALQDQEEIITLLAEIHGAISNWPKEIKAIIDQDGIYSLRDAFSEQEENEQKASA